MWVTPAQFGWIYIHTLVLIFANSYQLITLLKSRKSLNLKRNINRMCHEQLHYYCPQQLPTLRSHEISCSSGTREWNTQSAVPSLLAKNLIWHLSCWKQPKRNVKLSNQDILWNLVNCPYILHVIVVVKIDALNKTLQITANSLKSLRMLLGLQKRLQNTCYSEKVLTRNTSEFLILCFK